MLSEISQTEKDKHRMISLTCGIERQNKTNLKTTQKTELGDSGDGLVVATGDNLAVGKMREGGQKVQTSGYKINETWDGPYSLATRVKSAVPWI